MINFEREEAELQAAVGLSSEAILSGLDASSARRLADVRQRFEGFVAGQELRLSGPQRLERDRLDSLLQHLYGDTGLLLRAGALLSLRDRLFRISALAPRCMAAPESSDRLRREALLARTFAREQVLRSPTPNGARIAELVSRVSQSITQLDRFCASLKLRDTERTTHRRALGLYSVSDVADLGNEPKSLADGIAFVLRRLADASYIQQATGKLDTLCGEHAGSIRDLLWDAAEAGYGRRQTPATLLELTELDQVLEALRSKLTDTAVDAAERCAGIAQLYALVASSRAADAANEIDTALAPIKHTVVEGIGAEGSVG